ncbi:Rrf2 family transcriptional regulator [Roseomonas sp. E05]|uniref:RrF2 family transcriptional regulator n=1 Tax=Roseomonas sp. E05 TaxID=3046310 RepID=UPI0024BB9CEA|nr:Rrf2 family transcriptional regulator [Roseomonas sp. E05]MDJ0390638.1 Rrf2 family transcriptional regulator [Roseomonas sp. E05]
MRLLASTDFALRILMLLAMRPSGAPVSVEALARELGGLSRHHLHKIVQDLNDLGVTRTMRGMSGGVLLARAPAEIRLGQVIMRLEQEQALVECFRPGSAGCTLLPACRLKAALSAAQKHFYGHLDGYTLADMAAGQVSV